MARVWVWFLTTSLTLSARVVVASNLSDNLCGGPMLHPPGLSATLRGMRGPLYDMSGRPINMTDRVVALVHEDPQGVDGSDLWALAGFSILISCLLGFLAALCIGGGAVLEARHGRVQCMRADFVRC